MPILIYTDGCCIGNPGPGGYAAIIVNPDGTHRDITGHDPATTNNRMELMASIAALEAVPPGSELRVCSDNEYLINGMTIWLDQWKERGWKTAQRKPPENIDLWRRLNALDLQRCVEWVWVRGHNGDCFNELADRLANEATRSAVGGLGPERPQVG